MTDYMCGEEGGRRAHIQVEGEMSSHTLFLLDVQGEP